MAYWNLRPTLSILFSLFASTGATLAETKVAPRQWIDPATGHRIVRLSPDEGGTKLYFHQNAFVSEGKEMVMPSQGGLWVVNLAKLPEVSARPLLTERVGNIYAGAKSSNVYYSKDGAVYATSVSSKETKKIATLPPAMQRSAGFALNADETLLAGSYVEPADALGGVLPPRSPRNNPDRNRGGFQRPNLEEAWARRLPRRLFTISVATGEVKTFHPSTDWLNHVQFSPTDPQLLSFCHEGPWHKVDRLWTIKADGTGLTKRHSRTMDMEIAGHEFFSHDGKVLWYDLQTPKSKVFWLAGVDLTSGAVTRYSLEKKEWSVHYNISPDGKVFAGDGGGPNSVAKGDNGQWVYLFTPDGEKLRSERLADLREHDYDLEPNVNFTPDGKWIVYQANKHGRPHVYAVEVAKAQPGS